MLYGALEEAGRDVIGVGVDTLAVPADPVLWTNVLSLAATVFLALGVVAWTIGRLVAAPLALSVL